MKLKMQIDAIAVTICNLFRINCDRHRKYSAFMGFALDLLARSYYNLPIFSTAIAILINPDSRAENWLE